MHDLKKVEISTRGADILKEADMNVNLLSYPLDAHIQSKQLLLHMNVYNSVLTHNIHYLVYMPCLQKL